MFTTSPEIITTIILGASLFMMLSIIVALLIFRYKNNQQKHFIEIQQMQLEFEKQLIQSQTEVQEATFTALGKELHDNVGQLLSTTKMLLGITERQLPDPPDTLLTAEDTIAKAIRELRNLSKSLTREWLEQFDLMDNLRTELQRLEVTGELQVHFEGEGRLPFSSDHQVILFRIIQECIQNVIKHANATTLHVKIQPCIDELHISVMDNGIGFTEDHQTKGIGLMNMRHRIRLLKGQIKWISSPDDGTEVLIQLPIPKSEP